jgi:hypothetical protein
VIIIFYFFGDDGCFLVIMFNYNDNSDWIGDKAYCWLQCRRASDDFIILSFECAVFRGDENVKF